MQSIAQLQLGETVAVFGRGAVRLWATFGCRLLGLDGIIKPLIHFN